MRNPYIDLGFDKKWLLSPEQIEYFFTHAKRPNLSAETLAQFNPEYDYEWINHTQSLTLISDVNKFTTTDDEYDFTQNHLSAFPQYADLCEFFDHVHALDLAYVDDEVTGHQDFIPPDAPHSYLLKIIVYGSGKDFTMARIDENRCWQDEITIPESTNVFLMDCGHHVHMVPKNPTPFIVLFVEGIFNQKYRDLSWLTKEEI